MQNFNSSQEPLVKYRPAQFFFGKSTAYLEYYVWNPNNKTTDPLEKKRKKLVRDLKLFKTKREKIAKGLELCQRLNERLKNDWNPYLEDTAPKGFATVYKALNDWLLYYKHQKREDTTQWAEGRIKFFLKWFNEEKAKTSFIISVNRFIANNYIDHIYIERQNSIRTRTNNLDFFTQVFKWLENKGYIAHNPFSHVIRIKETGKRKKKIRTPINNEYPGMIKDYFNEKWPGYIYVINYLFLCMIRRTEMTKIQIKDVNLKNQTIYLAGDITKNLEWRHATIPDHFVKKMNQLGLSNLPPDYYLISDLDFYPGPKKLKPRRISSVWAHMRKSINLPKTHQFYSLRDTGVIEYLKNGVDNKSIKDQADWYDYAMIGVYADHLSTKGIKSIKEKGVMFG